MDPATIVLIIVAVVVIWLVLDLLLAGGGMTSGMMGGMAGMPVLSLSKGWAPVSGPSCSCC